MLRVTRLIVAADDRTGALEVAGACAAACGSAVPVHVGIDALRLAEQSAGTSVVDLATRHLEAAEAAEAVAALDAVGSLVTGPSAHKIDSTLRGNWAEEVVARRRSSGRRVLVVAAFPAVGRRCVGGVVTVDGVPVAASAAGADARRPARSSRPGDLLRDAGAAAVVEVRPGASLDAWLTDSDAAGAAVAVCDACDDADLALIGEAWSRYAHDVLYAGTAGSIAAAARSLLGARDVQADDAHDACADAADDVRAAMRAAPALVVCGSLHPVARAQIRRVAEAARPACVLVLESQVPAALPVSDADARAAADALAERARAELDSGRWATVIVIGGDTAAALLGDVSVTVGGTVGPGMPWFRRTGDARPVFVSKAGGFGDAATLTELLQLERTTG